MFYALANAASQDAPGGWTALETWMLVSQLLTAGAAFIGIYFVTRQLSAQRQIARADLIVKLNESFQSNRIMYHKLTQNAPLGKDDTGDLVQYLTFFETLHHLTREGVVPLAHIDDLFGYRFFVAANNLQVQKMELVPDQKFYRTFYTLHREWCAYRNKSGRDIFGGTGSLELVEGYAAAASENRG